MKKLRQNSSAEHAQHAMKVIAEHHLLQAHK
jgi:hypothetical protein